MLAPWKFIKCVILLVVLCGGGMAKRKKKINSDWRISHDVNKTAGNDTGRGLFFRGGLLSFSKVLNFFPVGGERECRPAGYRAARAGICLNAYDCRQRDGASAGDCAHGLGVCCVFEVSCGGVVANNLTYFLSPGFPELWTGDQDCNITVEQTHAGIMQLRIDFIHFTIGQPNRTTGECNEDAMVIGDGETKFTICGQNHGQHMYYTLSSRSSAREEGELAGGLATSISMRLRGGELPRVWLLRLAQVPLAQAAPHGCLQYHTDDNGTIKSFNYASNGRHLAGQDYRACVRRNRGRCAVRYVPCDPRAFRVGAGEPAPDVMDPADTEEMMPIQDDPTQEDEIEGSGDEPQVEAPVREQPGMLSRMWSYISSWMWGQSGGAARALRWSPYAQHYSDDDNFRYFGYGNSGYGLPGFGRQRCQDRVTIPCENEYFVASEYYNVGVCDPHHCGSTFCPGQSFENCRVETSITPFAVSVHFGPPRVKRSPEENIGMCLKYYQLPCDT